MERGSQTPGRSNDNMNGNANANPNPNHNAVPSAWEIKVSVRPIHNGQARNDGPQTDASVTYVYPNK